MDLGITFSRELEVAVTGQVNSHTSSKCSREFSYTSCRQLQLSDCVNRTEAKELLAKFVAPYPSVRFFYTDNKIAANNSTETEAATCTVEHRVAGRG